MARSELLAECDYEAEAAHIERFGSHVAAFNDLHAHHGGPLLHVPKVVPELSRAKVVTTELAPGHPIDYTRDLTQERRDLIGTQLLRLSLEELFFWRFMQTDPNWSNYLYCESLDQVAPPVAPLGLLVRFMGFALLIVRPGIPRSP